MENKNNYFKECKADISQSVRPSLFKTLEQVKAQIEYDSFYIIYVGRNGKQAKRIKPQVGEICLIISEVLIMQPEQEIKIGGSLICISLVQEVYKMLNYSHIELVVDNFEKIEAKIYNKKAYLRTALYNSVFEFESHYKNQVKHDIG